MLLISILLLLTWQRLFSAMEKKEFFATADAHHLSTSYLEIPRQSNCWAGEQHCAIGVEMWDPGAQDGPHILSWFPGSCLASVQSRFVSKIPGRIPLLQSQPEPRGWASLFLLMTYNDIHRSLCELNFQRMEKAGYGFPQRSPAGNTLSVFVPSSAACTSSLGSPFADTKWEWSGLQQKQSKLCCLHTMSNLGALVLISVNLPLPCHDSKQISAGSCLSFSAWAFPPSP